MSQMDQKRNDEPNRLSVIQFNVWLLALIQRHYRLSSAIISHFL